MQPRGTRDYCRRIRNGGIFPSQCSTKSAPPHWCYSHLFKLAHCMVVWESSRWVDLVTDSWARQLCFQSPDSKVNCRTENSEYLLRNSHFGFPLYLFYLFTLYYSQESIYIQGQLIRALPPFFSKKCVCLAFRVLRTTPGDSCCWRLSREWKQ